MQLEEKAYFNIKIIGNFPILKKDTTLQIQEGQGSPVRFNSCKSTPIHIKIKFSKVKSREFSKRQEKK